MVKNWTLAQLAGPNREADYAVGYDFSKLHDAWEAVPITRDITDDDLRLYLAESTPWCQSDDNPQEWYTHQVNWADVEAVLRPHAGRPPKRPDERKSARMQIRLYPDDKKWLIDNGASRWIESQIRQARGHEKNPPAE